MKVRNLHAFPLAMEEVNNFISNKEVEVLEKFKYIPVKGGNATLTTDHQILKDKRLKNLKAKMDAQANIYAKNILEISNDIYMTHSWVTKSEGNGLHPLHIHKGCLFSCAFYIKGKGKILFNFLRSRICEQMNLPFDVINFNNFNSDVYWYDTYPNLILMFPGNVQHGSSEHSSERMMLGCNYFVKGVIGKSQHWKVDEIKI